MTRFGKNILECLEICKSKIEKDLSERLETEVKINFIDNSTEISKTLCNLLMKTI